MKVSTPSATAAIEFRVDQYVLYRDPAKFWRGETGHTVVCRVDFVDRRGSGKVRYTLVPVAGGLIRDAQGDYMRLLPPVDAMRDIDTAPLNTEGAVDDMTAAAMAWLTQQHATANRRPELPAD
ncbi:hypothetical protein GCM10010232_65950 [Streptomyces amakusaensis]|uniref:Uncharacterized protein n=1 Tax=Streptomyces amakusaensis TaxID=67271 RepID=A0ABW0ARD8_9ACTN